MPKSQRYKYKVGDIVLYVETKQHKQTTYVTTIEALRDTSKGHSPYVLRGFIFSFGRKQLQLATPEVTLRYKLLDIKYAIPLHQL